MCINIDDLKKKIIYRSSYRGTKEMDTLLTSFTNRYIDSFDREELTYLLDLLDIDDTNLYNLNQGKKVSIPYRGGLDQTIKDILGGVRSTCTYVGAPSLKQLSKCTTFVRVNNQYNDVFGRV